MGGEVREGFPREAQTPAAAALSPRPGDAAHVLLSSDRLERPETQRFSAPALRVSHP